MADDDGARGGGGTPWWERGAPPPAGPGPDGGCRRWTEAFTRCRVEAPPPRGGSGDGDAGRAPAPAPVRRCEEVRRVMELCAGDRAPREVELHRSVTSAPVEAGRGPGGFPDFPAAFGRFPRLLEEEEAGGGEPGGEGGFRKEWSFEGAVSPEDVWKAFAKGMDALPKVLEVLEQELAGEAGDDAPRAGAEEPGRGAGRRPKLFRFWRSRRADPVDPGQAPQQPNVADEFRQQWKDA